jgi:hypothetical protein
MRSNNEAVETSVHPSKNSAVAVPSILLLLFLLAFVLFIYAFLHEGGHALAGILFGQSLTDFTIDLLKWDAHVGMAGGLTSPQEAVQSVAGTVLPLLVWFVFTGLVPRKAVFSLEVLKLISAMLVLNTLLPWIFIPVLYLSGNAPPSDDVTRFLRYSQMSPWLLMFSALLIYIRGWAFFLSRIDGLRNEFFLFRTLDRETLTAGARRVLTVIGSILVLVLLSTAVLSRVAGQNPRDRLSVPAGFHLVAEIDLSAHPYEQETLAEFAVDEPTYVGVYVIIREINTTYFDLSVIGPNGYRSTVIHGEGYNARRDGGLWEDYLEGGTYQIVLTSHQSPGTVSVYWKPDK